jgi:cytochrome b
MADDNSQIRVWDPLVRGFHWSLVASFGIAYLVGDDRLWLHVNAGYLVLGLVGFRLAWGLVGTRHAKFSDFVRGPATVIAYLGKMIVFRAERHIGHNPAGGAMVVALLLSLSATTLSGLVVYGHQEFMGPLAGLVSALPNGVGGVLRASHEMFANITVVLAIVHVAGVLIASLQHGENLVHSMLTGSKRKEINE